MKKKPHDGGMPHDEVSKNSSEPSIFHVSRLKDIFCGINDKLKLFLVMLALVFGRYCAYGFQYFPQLDDYIQLHNYKAFSESIPRLISETGMLAARPLAGLLDLTLWSQLFPSLFAVLLLSALYVWSGMLLKDTLSEHFPLSPLFLVFFALIPMGFEGLYWVSASNRIICGVFFACTSAYCFQKYLLERRKLLLPLSMGLFLVCCGFYEQAMVFGITLIVLIGMLCFFKAGKKAFWAFGVLPVSGLFFFLTSLVKNSKLYGGRAEIQPFFSEYYWRNVFPEIYAQVKKAFLGGGFHTFADGLRRAGKIILEDGLFWIILLFAISALFLYLIFPKEQNKKGNWKAYAVGFLLALAPVTPFFVLGNPWFSLRGTVMSFAGLAIIGDSLFLLLFGKNKKAPSAVAACFAFAFCVASVSEIHDYKQTTMDDRQVCEKLATLNSMGRKIAVIGLEPSFLKEQSFVYHEHIHGVTESVWALTGAVKYFSDNPHVSDYTPMPMEQPYYVHWNKEANQLTNFDLVYYYDFEKDSIKLTQIVKTDENAFDIYLDDVLFAKSYEEDGKGYLKRRG